MSWRLLFYLQLAKYQALIVTFFILTVACIWSQCWLRFSHHPKPLDPRYVHSKFAHGFSYVFGILKLIMLSSYIGQVPVQPDSTWNLTWHRSRDNSNYAMDLWVTKM